MKNLFIVALSVVYLYEPIGDILWCKIKYKKQGSSVVSEFNVCPQSTTLKEHLESIEGEEVELVLTKGL